MVTILNKQAIKNVGELKKILENIPDDVCLNMGTEKEGFEVTEVCYDGLSIALVTKDTSAKETLSEEISTGKNVLCKIPLPNGTELVSEKYSFDNDHTEISVYLEEDGIAAQDICLARPCEEDNTKVEVLVWTDNYSEDFTHRFLIEKYREEV